MTTLALDYTDWKGHWRWPSLQALLSSAEWQDGLHSVDEGEIPLDLALVNAAGLRARHKVLPVFFSAAVVAREGRPGPFLSGTGLATRAGFPALCLADPSLALDSDLGLAWYAGSGRSRTQDLLSAFLQTVAERFDCELLLIGGSGGGFAALYYGARLGQRASVLVWNPQTDLLKYYRPAVRAYLEACWPGPNWRSDEVLAGASRYLMQAGIEHSTIDRYRAGPGPRRLLYLQNADDDFHINHHVGPLLACLGLEDGGSRHYTDEAGCRTVWFGTWGDGHEPLPRPMLIELIGRLMDPIGTARIPSAWLNVGIDGSTPLLPLSFPNSASDIELGVEAKVVGDHLRVRARLWGQMPGRDVPQYAFYVYSGESRTHTRWYETDEEASFALGTERPTHVVAFALDNFGKKRRASAVVR